MAALITGHLDDAWLRAVRRWTMFAWIFLSFGLTLGMIWAYEELGWGGFWGGTRSRTRRAAVVHGDGLLSLGDGAGTPQHAARVERHARDPHVLPHDLRHVHDPLGVVQSVHSFGDNPELAMMFSIFMVVILLFSFGW
jgi:cytochrome c-type biogenesis protein CcmF